MSEIVPRIPPVPANVLTDEQKALLGEWRSMHFASVVVTQPELYRTLVPLIEKLISDSKLPARDREILVLRTLALCDEIYESAHHVLIARKAGMPDADIQQARAGQGAALSAFDRLLIKAAEELVRDKRIGDATWLQLAQRYTPVELMEVVALVGLYTMMAMLTKSYGIQLEDQGTFDNFEKLRKYT